MYCIDLAPSQTRRDRGSRSQRPVDARVGEIRRALQRFFATVRSRASVRLWNDAQIGAGRLPAAGVLLTRLLVRDRGRNDHIVARPPVDRGGNPMRRGELARIEEAQHLVEIAPAA